MGQRVLGVDLGSHSVKLADIDVGFRAARVLSLRTLAVPPGVGPWVERSLAVLQGAVKPESGQGSREAAMGGIDVTVVGVPGDKVLLRLLEVPAVEQRKLGAVVGSVLADDLPWEMEEVIFDHTTAGNRAGNVLTVVARSVEVRWFLEQLQALGLEPRSLPVAPLGYAGLVRRMAPSGCVLLCDLGHQRTNLCLFEDGRPLAARTVSRGGFQITDAIRAGFQLSFEEAESLKEREAHVLPEAPAAAGTGLAELTTSALAPIARDLGLSVGIFGAKLGVRPERVLLCGGTSQLPGIDAFLANQLRVPVERLRLEPTQDLPEVPAPEGQAVGALALGLALDGSSRQPLDLRQGEFAYKTDSSVVRDKIVTIAISLVLVLLFAALNAFMSLRALRQEEEALKVQLKKATESVFGEAILNPQKVSRQIKSGAKGGAFVIPQRTAFDILNYLSTQVPTSDKVKLDISRLEIKPGKTYLTGTADTRSAIGDVVSELQKNKCFNKVATGTISDVAEGKKQFSLTISTDCF
jgi:Tfp pilus assembly PilM family ATPase